MTMRTRVCELCHDRAALYCASDSAFLCFNCDARVHHANFLVARHVRQPLCSVCSGFSGTHFSGAESILPLRTCLSCSGKEYPDCFGSLSPSSSSSACVSSSESFSTVPGKIGFDDQYKAEKICASSSGTGITGEDSNIPSAIFPGEVSSAKKSQVKKKKQTLRVRARTGVDAKAEAVFANWCVKLGLNHNRIISPATHAFALCMGRISVLPLRVKLAASFWFGLRFCRDRSASMSQNLRRLEEISGVPAKVIVATEEKLARVLMAQRARGELKEGSAESST